MNVKKRRAPDLIQKAAQKWNSKIKVISFNAREDWYYYFALLTPSTSKNSLNPFIFFIELDLNWKWNDLTVLKSLLNCFHRKKNDWKLSLLIFANLNLQSIALCFIPKPESFALNSKMWMSHQNPPGKISYDWRWTNI